MAQANLFSPFEASISVRLLLVRLADPVDQLREVRASAQRRLLRETVVPLEHRLLLDELLVVVGEKDHLRQPREELLVGERVLLSNKIRIRIKNKNRKTK